MKKQIFIVFVGLLSLLLVMIIFVAINTSIMHNKFELDSVDSTEIIERPLTFETNSVSIKFSANDYTNIVKIFENADLQTMRFEMNPNDSVGYVNIGVIDKYKFQYRNMFNFHIMIISDTTINKEYYILRAGKFIDELILH